MSEPARSADPAVSLRGLVKASYGDRRPHEPSGGQRQRVALVNRPRVLLLDEPLGALDLKLRRKMQIELKGLQRDVGITFLFVTHDQEEALTMSDRIAVFNDGRIEQVASPVELYERPATTFVAGGACGGKPRRPGVCGDPKRVAVDLAGDGSAVRRAPLRTGRRCGGARCGRVGGVVGPAADGSARGGP